MKRVCAWCKKTITDTIPKSNQSDTPISHGICPDCIRKVLVFEAIPLRDFLNRFSGPVLLVDEDGKIITANNEGYSVLQKGPQEVEGHPGGDVFGCKYADLPEGCGKTIHCKSCTIRNTVTDTLETGKSHSHVPAFPDLHHVTDENKIKFLISTEKVGKTVLLRIDEISEVYKSPH